MEQQQQQLQHFIYPQHPLVFNLDDRRGYDCVGCNESIYGPSYSCTESGCYHYSHHKSCAELPLGLHHPLHPIHPLILFSPKLWAYNNEDKQLYKCELCKEDRDEYIYRCSRCDFNLHITCASLAPTTIEPEFHHHPLIPVQKWITFTCDLCGIKDKGMPYLCNSCGFWIHRKCTLFPRIVKVVRHKHLLHLTHSSLQFHPSDSRFCQICVEKVDTHYGLYYCSRCDFAAHLDCAMGNNEHINLQEFKDKDEVSEHDELVDSAAYEVKKFNVGMDGIQIAAELKHFSHKHDLKLTEEVMSNQKCDGCVRDIFPPFYSCVKCSFFLHESCANLPKKKRHPLHQHPLTLLSKPPYGYPLLQRPLTLFPKTPYAKKDFWCYACKRDGNGFNYSCVPCRFSLDIPCSLISDTLTHPGHEHRLILSSIKSGQNCSGCDSNIYPIFRCTTCAFALDFKCATLPLTTRYRQHEHAFTLSYTAEDDSGEYYCDICEEERVPKHWFYYCVDCSYPAHPKCILRKYPNYKFGGALTLEALSNFTTTHTSLL